MPPFEFWVGSGPCVKGVVWPAEWALVAICPLEQAVAPLVQSRGSCLQECSLLQVRKLVSCWLLGTAAHCTAPYIWSEQAVPIWEMVSRETRVWNCYQDGRSQKAKSPEGCLFSVLVDSIVSAETSKYL